MPSTHGSHEHERFLFSPRNEVTARTRARAATRGDGSAVARAAFPRHVAPPAVDARQKSACNIPPLTRINPDLLQNACIGVGVKFHIQVYIRSFGLNRRAPRAGTRRSAAPFARSLGSSAPRPAPSSSPGSSCRPQGVSVAEAAFPSSLGRFGSGAGCPAPSRGTGAQPTSGRHRTRFVRPTAKSFCS